MDEITLFNLETFVEAIDDLKEAMTKLGYLEWTKLSGLRRDVLEAVVSSEMTKSMASLNIKEEL